MSWQPFVLNRYTFVLLGLYLLVTACENDLKKVQEISAKEVNTPFERTTGVEVIYSDSAKVKAKMLTPVMLHYKVEKPYYEFPDGVTLDVFDEKSKDKSTVTADYAITSNDDKLITLRKNVVGKNAKGDTFKSEELIYDQEKKIFYSNQPVTITTLSGNVISGTSFEGNEDFSLWTIKQSSGNFNVNEDFQ
jgi:LPS export ABC transporter protein LptC